MTQDKSTLAADDAFFQALLAADVGTLGTLLADDFVLVGVFDGGLVDKEGLLGVLASGQLTFVSIVPADRTVRQYGDAAVVIGRTSMTCQFAGAEIGVESRYTHVFTMVDDRWVLASAQGTPIK